jgi:hypothetical protein
MNVEQDLRRALRRKPGPPDLADRVLARIEARPSATTWSAAHRGLTRWLAAAAAVAIVATGAARYYEQQKTIAEAERVERDVRLALQITSEKLAFVQQRVEQSGRD